MFIIVQQHVINFHRLNPCRYPAEIPKIQNKNIFKQIPGLIFEQQVKLRKALASVAVATSPYSPSNSSDSPRRGRSDRSRAGSPGLRRNKEGLAHVKLPVRPETWILSWKNKGWIRQMLRESIQICGMIWVQIKFGLLAQVFHWPWT